MAKKISFLTRRDRDRFHASTGDWEDCEACPLHEGRIQTVHFRGQVPAQVIFIGESPGESEDALGYPFIGGAGKLLDEMIEDIEGVDRFRLGFVNLTACLTPGRSPSAKEVKTCRPRLTDLLVCLRPLLLVALGKVAHRHLRASEGDVPGAPGAKVVSVSHPEDILKVLEKLPTQAALDQKRFRLTVARALEDL